LAPPARISLLGGHIPIPRYSLCDPLSPIAILAIVTLAPRNAITIPDQIANRRGQRVGKNLPTSKARPPLQTHAMLAVLCLLNALLSLLVIVYGFDYAYPAEWRFAIYRGASVIFLAGLAALAILSPRAIRGPDADLVQIERAGTLFCAWQLALNLFFHLPTVTAIAAILVLAAVIAACFHRIIKSAYWAAFATWVACALYYMRHHPLGEGADMLPFITHAISVAAHGGNPYTADYSSITDNPFYYLPYQWLLYFPAWLIGCDLRVINVICAVACVLVIEIAAGRIARLPAFLYPFLLCSFTIPMMVEGELWPYWLCILSVALLLLRGRVRAGVVVLAITVGIRQTALVPLAVIMVMLLGQMHLRAWLRLSVLVGLAGGIMPVIATLAWGPSMWRTILIDGPRIGAAKSLLIHNPLNQIGASNFVAYAGLSQRASLIQAAMAVLLLGVAFLYAGRGNKNLLCCTGLIYTVVMSFNPFIHVYYYLSGLMIFAAGLAYQES